MTFVFDCNVAGINATSYACVAAADDYFTGRLGASDWTALSNAQKEAALSMATVRLESESYQGVRTFADQRLQWPRNAVFDRDEVLLPNDAIPEFVKQATYEMALALVKDPELLDDSGLEAFQSVGLGSLGVSTRVRRSDELPSMVRRLLGDVRLSKTGTVSRG